MIRTVLTATGLTLALMAVPLGVRAHDAHGRTAAAQGHRHAEFQSDRFHVRVEGEGRDIILIPGLSSSPEVWDSTVAHLGTGWRVHRLHVQGFAGAEPKANAEGPVAAPVAEDLARYIVENDLNKPAVVGHSMGGTIAMMLAARHPDAVGRVMVVDMVPFMGAMFGAPGTNPTPESVAPIADKIYAGMADGPQAAYEAQAATAIDGMINNEALRAGPTNDMRTSDRKTSAGAYRELVVTDLRPELPRITAPTKVLYVKFNYPGMTAEMTDAIYQGSFATLPGAELKRIDDSAHFIMFDQPAAFNAELDAFLAE